jgi:hypothetical protein
MWKLKKMGYYMYVGASVVSFVLPIVMLGLPFNAMGIFWVVLFAALYGMNLKHMN